MKRSYLALLVSVIFILATAGVSFAAMGEGTVSAKKGVDLTLFGNNRFIPTYSTNLIDFDSSNPSGNDPLTLDEGGFGAGFFVRNELRIGFAGKGENFGFKVILENDIHYSKDNVDRNTYSGYGNVSSDFGSEFSVERSNFWYDFGPVKLSTGWDVTFQDLKTGGLLYGDDHPYIMLSGEVDKVMDWQVYMLLINDSDDVNSTGGNHYRDTDWYTYNAKFNFKFCGLTLSPFFTYSDMRKGIQKYGNAQAYYAGFEGYGKIGMLMPSFEVVGVTGTINDAAPGGKDYDIRSWAAFAALKLDLMPEFQPYLGGFYVQGDDDLTDDDAEGFVGITNITRYTPTFGMEGAIMYEHLGSLGAPLYGLVPERLGGGSATYGGIGAGGTGNNPGLIYLGMGATGKLDKVSYKVQTAYMWFAEKDGLNLKNDEIGWTVDALVTYPLSSNVVTSFCTSFLDPGDGVQDLLGKKANDTAWISRLEICWSW